MPPGLPVWLHMKHMVEGGVVFPDLVDSMKCHCWFMKCLVRPSAGMALLFLWVWNDSL